jgi:hypothetical protein
MGGAFLLLMKIIVEVNESASRLLIILVIMTMQFGKINAFNEICAGLKNK